MEIRIENLQNLINKTDFEKNIDWAEKLGITKDKLDHIIKTGKVESQEELYDLCSFFGVTPTDLDTRERPQIDYKDREAGNNFLDVVNNDITPARPYRVLEVFAGAGGLMLGLEEAGFEAAAALEIDKHACSTLRTNRPDLNVIEGDIADIVKEGIRNYIGDEEIDILSGGYPCQAFSFAGKKLGLKDARGTMFYWYAQLLNELRPKMFLAENVRGLVSHEKGKTLQGMMDVFDEIGYNVTYKVLKATNYNVAQKRERIFIIGTRKDFESNFRFPAPRDYIPVLRDVLQNVPDSPGRQYPERKREIMEMVPPGGYWRDLPIEIQMEYMKGSFYLGGGKTGIARRISWDEPCLTLTTAPDMKQTERCHPDETRPFTVREYARIQSFPDNWIFEGSMTQQYKQIGNAVPMELARHVGLSMIHTLNQMVAPNTNNYNVNENNQKVVEQMNLFSIPN
ncbi:modification methylase [Alkalihalobacillus alcalophilus ATCC 27647 = CGMCC 1.3604]|uniref:Cytosine-specific methyltransferase n=1 Tax=Alkalihalobacillus alcalophilus ATCC 27647 = CGMCC 1.3604 TaxID=1218173 RepID=A0A094YTH8_ALKAL|nr:DNA cytosine methyltransferase [Alkalihalobacillus alcalophilus]KGA96742.1 modification methylase [Alkalihalobacillus alcalophilus ATCC 27647 = CGMCC 1.3604]MED1563812.1 DNA cytosine methyltransferase [Alkalihalobacillus alcalophilus]THG92116.1 modification methylase [Alkalihalobacillus alcalophilus ATCC 27647 = CGMCC 1.3604]